MSGNNHHPSRNEYERMMRNVRNEPIYQAARAKAKAEAKARWAAMSKKQKDEVYGAIICFIGIVIVLILIKL